MCLGRLAKEKSFDIIVKGYKNYLTKYTNQNTILIFVGDGPAKTDLIDLVNQLELSNNVKFLGKVSNEEVFKYYLISDLFVNASISETQGLTFMEAMASSVPVLCRFDNNLVGVIDNNKTGFFFIDELDFADKLFYVLNLNKEQINTICENALKSIDSFSEQSFYINIIEVYKRAIRRYW